MNILMGASIGSPGPCAIPLMTNSSNFQGPAPTPAETNVEIIPEAARAVAASALGLVPTNIPRTAPPPVTCHCRTVQPPAANDLLIDWVILAISKVPPNMNMSIRVPCGKVAAKAVSRDCPSGVKTRSASLASSWSRASLSCSAIRLASAARSLALAISRRNPSALALASAACCSASAARSFAPARFSSALLARSIASAASLRASPASRFNRAISVRCSMSSTRSMACNLLLSIQLRTPTPTSPTIPIATSTPNTCIQVPRAESADTSSVLFMGNDFDEEYFSFYVVVGGIGGLIYLVFTLRRRGPR